MRLSYLPIAGLALALASPLSAQTAPESAASGRLSYADIADLALASPIVAVATIDNAIPLRDERAVGVPAGLVRFYVEADLTTLIRSGQPIASRIRYLVDARLAPDGDRPELEGRIVLLMMRAAPGRPGEMQLVTRDAQLDWSPELEARVRAVLGEATGGDAPPQVTGIGSAFSVPGALPGESETQIFLTTADGRPVSLTVLRRPGEQTRWSVSLGEIVESSSRPPERDTLLWYRLACALPPALPRTAMEEGNAQNFATAEADYRFVLEALGECVRTRG